jgi:release factor glutamine methyltransferase
VPPFRDDMAKLRTTDKRLSSALPVDSPTTLREALALARSYGLSSAEARALLAYVSGHDTTWPLAHPEARLDSAQAERFAALVTRLASGEPLPYLTGQVEFYTRTFTVTPAVLIPRPETEHLAEAALDWLAGPGSPLIVDVGTGSGAIGTTLAAELPGARVALIDSSAAALTVAKCNAARHGVSERVWPVCGDLLAALRGPFDLIAANLPYIPSGELDSLDVARWEPHAALDGGPDGLRAIRALLAQAPSRLARPGLLLIEVGAGQAETVLLTARDAFPEARLEALRDYAGHERVVRIERGEP